MVNLDEELNKTESQGDSNFAEEEVGGLNFGEVKALVDENGKITLKEFIGEYDELESVSNEIEDPEKKEEVKKENEFMRKQVEEYWRSLHNNMKRAEKGEEISGGNAENPGRTEEAQMNSKKTEEGEIEENRKEEGLSEGEASEGKEYINNVFSILDEEGLTENERKLIEEYENAEDKDAIIEKTRKEYADKLGLGENYREDGDEKKKFEEARENIGKKMIDSKLLKGLQDKEGEVARIIEEGEEILAEGNPEKAREYFMEVAGTMDDAAKYLQFMYLQMEADPVMREKMRSEYLSIVTAVEQFEEASRQLKELIAITEKAKEEGRMLTEEEKAKMANWLDYAKATLFIVGVAVASIRKISKYVKELAYAHPTIAKVAGLGVGSVALFPSGATTAKCLCLFGGIYYLLNERKRDALVEKILGVKLPSWAKAPEKKKE